jgi:hypothetical protein
LGRFRLRELIAMRLAGTVIILAITLLSSGCSWISPDPEFPDVTLTTWPAETEGNSCGGVDLGMLVVRGDPDAEQGRQVWVVSEEYGELWPVWPHGWTATATPTLQIYDRAGRLAVADGDAFRAGGSVKDDGTVWLCQINDWQGL